MPEDEKEAPAVPPCAACKLLRRRCVPQCIFAPYFPADSDMSRFYAVHRVFGACSTSKMLQAVERPEQRGLAADTLVEEARARARDPTFGCVSYIRILQEFNDNARRQVEEAREEIAREFGPVLASESVDVAAADPEVRMEARAQVAAALKEAREIDDRLLGLRNAKDNEPRLRELQQRVKIVKRHRWQMDRDTNLQMPETQKTRFAADADQHGHRLASQHEETEPRPRVAEGYGHGQMSEWQQLTPAAEAARVEAMASGQTPAAATGSSSYLLGQEGQPRQQQMTEMGQWNAAAAAAAAREQNAATAWQQHQDRAPPQYAGTRDGLQEMQMEETSTADLAEKMGIMPRQFAAAQQYHDPAPLHDRFANLADVAAQFDSPEEFGEWFGKELDALEAERSGNQDMMPWDAASSGVMVEQGVMTMTMTQQSAAAAWQHQDLAPRPEQMEDASTAELAKKLGIMSQQQYHDPAAVHYTSPWLQQPRQPQEMALQMAEAQQPATTSQVATAELLAPDMLLAGARQFGNLAAQYDDGTEFTLGYGDTDMHQQVAVAGKVARAPGMNTPHGAAAVEQEPMQFDMGTQQWRRLSEKEIEVYQKLVVAMKEQTAKKLVAAGLAGEQEMITQKPAAEQQPQQRRVYSQKEIEVVYQKLAAAMKEEEIKKQVAAARLAGEQERITQNAAATQHQQQQPVAQYSETELGVSLGQGQPFRHLPSSTPFTELADVVELARRPNTTSVQQLAANANGELWSGAGATMALLSSGHVEASPFAVDQQPHPQVQTTTALGIQMGSSLLPLPPLLGQQHAQVSDQQREDGGGQGQYSDLASYLYY